MVTMKIRKIRIHWAKISKKLSIGNQSEIWRAKTLQFSLEHGTYTMFQEWNHADHKTQIP
ncbi:hypothetical protein NQ318_020120 [Aromia moschata]|uniref:Uncharacterized protein n=1 Tax=Aromia moschata TaxID=1265417 RepID=A0AAV8Z9E3_9CUCU|nr:hypothetical protein NQ318_020120 [Aromia moschata]